MSHPRLLIVGTIPYNTKDSQEHLRRIFIIGRKRASPRFFLILKHQLKDIAEHCSRLQTTACYNGGKGEMLKQVLFTTMMSFQHQQSQKNV